MRAGADAGHTTKGHGDLDIFVRLVAAGAQRYYSGKCLNITAYKAEQLRPDAKGWGYLACTEIVHPIGANNVTDMFPPFVWSVASNDQWCVPQYNISSRPHHIPTQFGLSHQDSFARAHSRIAFVYGLRDPWHTLGWPVDADLAPELPLITIADGSHCADMTLPSEHDTAAMKAGRAKVAAQLGTWVAEVYAEKAAAAARAAARPMRRKKRADL
jgi:lysosomal Pro-X carboxypeptidase